MHKILPQYLGPKEELEKGKRKHGRGGADYEQVKNMGKKS